MSCTMSIVLCRSFSAWLPRIGLMPTYQADAVVLRRLDYGEADRILTLLTREHGKLAAIAKGSRRAKARSGNSLDLFARSRMMLAKGRNLDVVAQVERRGDVRHISGDLHRTAYACLVAEVADKVLEERHPVDDVFELVVVSIERLNMPERPARAESAWFLMRILDLLEIGRAHSELQSQSNLVCRLLLEKKKIH